MPPLASAPTRWPHPSPPELGACSQRRLALARLGPGCRPGSSAVSQIPRSAATCNCFSASERVLSASRSTYQFPGTSVDQNENKSALTEISNEEAYCLCISVDQPNPQPNPRCCKHYQTLLTPSPTLVAANTTKPSYL
jgi:hypothetical protein